MSLFYGNNQNIANKIIKIFYGNINNIAKEIKQIYLGNKDDKATLVYNSTLPYEYKLYTASGTFTVPKGVKKLKLPLSAAAVHQLHHKMKVMLMVVKAEHHQHLE